MFCAPNMVQSSVRWPCITWNRDRLWNIMMKQNIYLKKREKTYKFLGNSISYDFVCLIAINEDENEEKSNLLSVESLIRRRSNNRCLKWNAPFNSDSILFFLNWWNSIYIVKMHKCKKRIQKEKNRRLNQMSEFSAHKNCNVVYICMPLQRYNQMNRNKLSN